MRTALVCILALVCAPASALGLSFDWGPTKKCFDSKSPPITVTAVPGGTVKLRFKMKDLNAPDFMHGGGNVAYKGSGKIPYGSFSYRGPCPPFPHKYQISVDAVDASGKVLASANAQRRFP